jgi:uncharacterized protein YukE
MSKTTAQTTSFMMRFTQKIYDNEQGEPTVQWRGRVSHVQSGDQTSFSEFHEAVSFVQKKLAEQTILAIEDKSPEEKEGLISKSFDLWKRMTLDYPKLVLEVIKDPKRQVAQIQDQISQVGDELGQKIEIDSWRSATKADFKDLQKQLDSMSNELLSLHKKLDQLTKSKK